MKKLVASATVLMCGTMMLAPGVGSAMTQDELQAQIDLLLAQLTDLQDQLDDGEDVTPIAGGTIAGCEITSFDRNLKAGMTGSDVKCLQIVLNSDSDTVLGESGAGSPGNETSYFGPITKAGVVKFQEKYTEEVLSPYGLTTGTGFVGSTTRAQLNVILAAGGEEEEVKAPSEIDNAVECITAGYYWGPDGCYNGDGEEGEEEEEEEEEEGPAAEDIDNSTDCIDAGYYWGPDGCYSGAEAGDGVALSSDTPAATTLVGGQATAELVRFTFTSSDSYTVTGMTLKRLGVSANTTPSNVYLFDGATRLTDAGTVNSDGVVNFVDANGLFVVSGTKTISVQADIAVVAGETLGMQLTAVTLDSGDLDDDLPISGNIHSIATATLAGVSLGAITPGTSSIDSANDVIVWESTATVSTRKVSLTRLALRNIGSINSSDVENFRLLVSGVEVAQTQNLDTNGYVTFDLSASPYELNTGNRVMRVMADVIGGASRNLQISLRRAADIGLVDSSFNVNVSATDVYPASTGVISINPGTMTVVKASDSPSGSITDGAVDAVLASYTFTAFGEPIKVETLNATFDCSDDNVTQLRQGRIMVDGTQAGSSAALVEINTTATGTQYTTNFIVNPGTPVTVEIRADVFDDGTTNDVNANDTFIARLLLGANNGVPQTSLGTINVPTAFQVGNQVTVATGSAALVETLSYPDQTMTIPQTAYKIAEWDLTNGSTEAANITTLDADFACVQQLLITNLSDVYIKYGSNTSTVKSSVEATTNAWSVSFQLAKNESMKVQVFANISTFVVADDNDTVTVTMEVTGTGADSAGAVTTGAVGGQTMTAGTSTILATASAGTSDSALIDDSGTVRVAAFDFTTTNDQYTITGINVNLASASAVTNVLLMDGTTQLQSKPGAEDVTFAGLSIPVVANDTKTLNIDLVMSTVGHGAGTSASDVMVTLDSVTTQDSQGVEYVDLSPETAQTDLADNGADPAGNATYVYKAVPTITLVNLPSGTLGTGTKVLAKFTVDTGGTGTIAWRKLHFTVLKSIAAADGVVSVPTLWNSSSSTQIIGTGVVTTLGGANTAGSITFLATNEQQISGAKTYELRATIAGTIVTATDSINTSIANPLTDFTASRAAYASHAASTYRYYDVADAATSSAGDIRQSTAIQMTAPDVPVDTDVTGHDASTTTEQTYGITGSITLTLAEAADNVTAADAFTVTGAGSAAFIAAGGTCTPFTGIAGTGAANTGTTFSSIQSVTCTATGMQLLLRDITVVDDGDANASSPGLVIVYTKGTDFAANSTVAANDSDDTLALTAGVDATASFLWSDRSTQSHGIATTDWTDDFLVKSLPTSTQNLE